MNIYDQILQLCVSTDELRPELKVPCRREGKVIATNGHILVAMDANLTEGDYGDNEFCESCGEWRNAETKIVFGSNEVCGHARVVKFPKQGGHLIGETLAAGNLNGAGGFFDLAAVEAALAKYKKSSIYERKPCESDGCNNGKVYCRCCRYENDCDSCGGVGYTLTNKVVGESYESNAKIRICANYFQAVYVSMVAKIMRLTGCDAEVTAQVESGGTVFRIGAVDCLVMPMKHKYRNSEDFPSVELRTQ